MKKKNLLSHKYKRTWTGKIIMTDRNLVQVILVAAVAGAIATAIIKRRIKKRILEISTLNPCKARNNNTSEFHESAYSAEFSDDGMNS